MLNNGPEQFIMWQNCSDVSTWLIHRLIKSNSQKNVSKVARDWQGQIYESLVTSHGPELNQNYDLKRRKIECYGMREIFCGSFYVYIKVVNYFNIIHKKM